MFSTVQYIQARNVSAFRDKTLALFVYFQTFRRAKARTTSTMPVPNCIANDSLEVMSDVGDEWDQFTSDLDSSLSDL